MTARFLLIAAFLYFAALIGGLYVKLHASEKCTPVDPASMVWTGHGFSIAMNDGHLWINRKDVVYAEVAQPHVCMPAKGMMQLFLPHAWPAYALTLKSSPYVQLAHQKLASNEWIDRSSNKNGQRCCDAGKDCHSIDADKVRPTQGGVMVQLDTQSIFVPGDQIMPSEDGKYWVCYWGGQIKCFFAPYSGS